MFNSKKEIIWIFLFMSLFSASQTMQLNGLDDLAGKLIRSLRSDIKENIFIHTDKSVYKAGETVWFNAYLVNKVSHKISAQSKIAFVDLVNERDSMISQLVLDAKSLRLNGSIQLPIELQDGNYWLRGYTNNILQTDSSDICVYPIYVVNPQNISKVRHDVSPEINPVVNGIPKFEIYPEGGALIAGVNSLVAFRITDSNNNPLEISGYVKDNRDSITTRFKTSLPGIGKFYLFPWSIRRYTVFIETKTGQKFSYLLPATNNYAACLSVVSENENTLRVRISLADSLYYKKTDTYLLGISRDSLCFAAMGEGMYETDIPKKNFPQGEATLLLFDQNEQLLSERSIYLDKSSTIVNVKTDKENYIARENVTLNISVNDVDGHPELSLLSVSVTDDSSVKYFNDADIETIMKKPFSAEEKDLILLAQKNVYTKWRLSDSAFSKKNTRIDEYLFGTHGTILNQKNQPMQNIVVTLFSPKAGGIFKTDTTDKNGHFNFNLPAFADTVQFMLQASDKKGKAIDAKIILDSTSLPKFNTPLYLKKPLPALAIKEIIKKREEQQDFLLSAKGKVLKEVIVRSKLKQLLNYDEQKRISQFSKIITSDMLQRAGFGNMSTVLFMIPGAHMRNGKLIIDPGGDAEPLVIMDGVEVPITNVIKTKEGKDTSGGNSGLINFLNSLSPRNIDFIEVLNGPEAAFYGVRGGNGVIVINSLSEQKINYPDKKNALKRFYSRAFTQSPQFTEPDYNKRVTKKDKTPDQRSTIYWSGPVITDDNGKATINFFTADPGTTYTVTIKGITSSGDIFFKRFLINRK